MSYAVRAALRFNVNKATETGRGKEALEINGFIFLMKVCVH